MNFCKNDYGLSSCPDRIKSLNERLNLYAENKSPSGRNNSASEIESLKNLNVANQIKLKNQYQIQFDNLGNKLRELQITVRRQSNELEKKNEIIVNLENTLAEEQRINVRNRETVETIKAKLLRKDYDIQQYHTELEDKKLDFDRLIRQLKQISDRDNASQNECNRLKNQVQQLQQDLNNEREKLKNEKSNNSYNLMDADAKLKNALNVIKDLEMKTNNKSNPDSNNDGTLEKMRRQHLAQLENLKNKTTGHLEKTRSEMQKLLDLENRSNKSVLAENDNLNEKLSNLVRHVHQLEAEIQSLTDSNNDLSNALNAERERGSRKEADLKNIIKELNDQTSNSLERCVNGAEKHAVITGEIEKYASILDKIENKRSPFQERPRTGECRRNTPRSTPISPECNSKFFNPRENCPKIDISGRIKNLKPNYEIPLTTYQYSFNDLSSPSFSTYARGK
ncbi:hypothetical protein A3Q56_03314 [Intoshia linei]|uniref:Uncharacterized protein n=1 Tax=Intoshia linei TaxID=1819745 RepID=A0A177B695_9BILA|nr:hypothetical protein A3Q56_03314 [Intoshia linei]